MIENKGVDYEIDADIKEIDKTVEALMIDIRFLSPSDLDKENVDKNTFITSFMIIHQVETMTTNTITKAKLCYTLEELINTNTVKMKAPS